MAPRTTRREEEVMARLGISAATTQKELGRMSRFESMKMRFVSVTKAGLKDIFAF